MAVKSASSRVTAVCFSCYDQRYLVTKPVVFFFSCSTFVVDGSIIGGGRSALVVCDCLSPICAGAYGCSALFASILAVRSGSQTFERHLRTCAGRVLFLDNLNFSHLMFLG
jgi:hypothetical protein